MVSRRSTLEDLTIMRADLSAVVVVVVAPLIAPCSTVDIDFLAAFFPDFDFSEVVALPSIFDLGLLVGATLLGILMEWCSFL